MRPAGGWGDAGRIEGHTRISPSTTPTGDRSSWKWPLLLPSSPDLVLII